MQVAHGIDELVRCLPVLEGRVFVPQGTLEEVRAGQSHALLDASYLMSGVDETDRASWLPWYTASVLRRVPWGSAPAGELLAAWFVPHSAVEGDFDGSFSDSDVPVSTSVPPGMTREERLRWWATAVRVKAWSRTGTATADVLRAASQIEVAACEERVGIDLPESLRNYHLALGASQTAEEILPLTPVGYEAVGPLLEAFPGIPDLVEELPDSARILDQVDQMVAFGSYLGNGNYWCVDRADGAVWYFDHEGGMDRRWRGRQRTTVLTRMFDDVGDYFDALTVIAIGRAHEELGEEDTSEDVLREMLGNEKVQTWFY